MMTKQAETATTDARIDERMRQLSFGLKEFKNIVISHDLTEKIEQTLKN